jgi:hypothetical protein
MRRNASPLESDEIASREAWKKDGRLCIWGGTTIVNKDVESGSGA